MSDSERGWAAIDAAVKLVQSHRDEFDFFLVINTKSRARENGIHKNPLLTDFFSDEELSDLILASRSLGIRTEFINGEAEFARAISQKCFSCKLPKVVYSSSGQYFWRSRSALTPGLCAIFGAHSCISDAYVMALTEHKIHTFCLLSAWGLPIPPSGGFAVGRGWLRGWQPDPGDKIILKPAYGCASIGIDNGAVLQYTRSADKLIEARARAIGQPLLVQKFISGHEIEVPVCDHGETFALGASGVAIGSQMLLVDEILDYDTVYSDNYSFYDYRSVDHVSADAICAAAETAYKILEFSGFARIDFRCGENGNFYITDVTGIPHMTRHGAVAHAFSQAKRPYEHAIGAMIGVGVQRWLKMRPDFN